MPYLLCCEVIHLNPVVQCSMGFWGVYQILHNPQDMVQAEALQAEKVNLYLEFRSISRKMDHFPFQTGRSSRYSKHHQVAS